MADEISYTFLYTTDDSFRAASFLRDRSFVYRNDVWLTSGIVFLVCVAAILVLADDPGFMRLIGAIPLSLTLAVIAGMAVFLLHRFIFPRFIRRSINQYFDASPSSTLDTTLTFSREGLKMETNLGSGLLTWPAITEVIESETDYFFYTGKSLATFLPKHVIKDDPERSDFRQLLAKFAGYRPSLQIEGRHAS